MLSALARQLKLDLVRKDDRVAELNGLKPDAIDWTKRVDFCDGATPTRDGSREPHQYKLDPHAGQKNVENVLPLSVGRVCSRASPMKVTCSRL